MSMKKTYEAPRIIAREDLKQITLYTGTRGDGNRSGGGRSGPRDLFWTT